eukprot:462072_1
MAQENNEKENKGWERKFDEWMGDGRKMVKNNENGRNLKFNVKMEISREIFRDGKRWVYVEWEDNIFDMNNDDKEKYKIFKNEIKKEKLLKNNKINVSWKNGWILVNDFCD